MPPPSSSATSTSNHRSRYPSAALWSLFTTVVASSSVQAVAVPPPFLCPSLGSSSYNDTPCLQDRSIYPSLPSVPRQHYPGSKNRNRRRRMPVMYKEGDDGRWRKVMKYTLYGSTISVAECHYPTASIPSVDDEVNNSGTITTSSAVADSTFAQESDIIDSLPNGWKPHIHEERTALILTISLVLAFFICVVIISCILWRRSLRRMQDIERRARKKKAHKEDDLEVMVEKELKSKRKLWARATAAWKANARYTARQRRGRRRIVLNNDAASIRTHVSRDISEDDSSVLHSPRSISQHPSTDSLATTQPSIMSPEDVMPQNESTAPTLPPAYRHHSPLASTHTSNLSTVQDLSRSHEEYQRPPSRSSFSEHPTTDDSELLHPTYSPPSHSAHVATDDKAILEQMNHLASEPPSEGSSDPSQSQDEGSAPVWYDEQYEDFDSPETAQPPPSSSSNTLDPPYHPLFPPPPTTSTSEKGKMRAYYEYEYSFGATSFDHDILTAEPEPGPSAPPFESVEGFELCPSAPPFGGEYVDGLGAIPSAPSSEDLFDAEPPRSPAGSTLPENQVQNSLSLTSTAPIQGPPTEDGIPPAYHS